MLPAKTPSLEQVSLSHLQELFKLKFDCLVADCEGFLPQFFEENQWFLDQLRVIIYEKDGHPWSAFQEKYKTLDQTLQAKGFEMADCVPISAAFPNILNNPTWQSVWVKKI